MKIFFLLIAYPDVNADANMYTDLTYEFHKKGHEIYVAAPGKGSTGMNLEGGINVLRIKTLPLFKTSFIKKGISNLMLSYQYTRAIQKNLCDIDFDLIVTATPPITFVSTIKFLKKRSKAKLYLILRDIFPQNAKDLGLIKSDLIFSYFRSKEKKLYELADSIGCMSKQNIDYVLSNNVEVKAEKLHLLPNWANIHELPLNNSDIRSEYKLNSKFIAVFGGNLGIPQKIDFIVEVAEKIENKKILFLLVGEGTELKKIKNVISEKSLENVRILSHLPRKEYLSLLQVCDVGLVNLSDKFTIPNIPSRSLSYWSLKLPIIAAIDKNTDFGELLDNSEGGLWSITGDTQSYIDNLLSLYNNPQKRKQMGENGYNFLSRELNSENAYKIIISSI
jgi:glycosyltransferase involved in cell wall biosynthesis